MREVKKKKLIRWNLNFEMELEDQARRTASILTTLTYENKLLNSIMSKKDDLNRMIDIAKSKRKKEIEGKNELWVFERIGAIEKNGEIEETLARDTTERLLGGNLNLVIEEENVVKEEIKNLQKEEKDLVIKYNSILERKENIVENELKEIVKKEKEIEKMR